MTASHQLIEIVTAIAQLSPAERRLLQRHLRAAGLSVNEDFVTDKHRLRIAPALGVQMQSPQQDSATGSATPIALNQARQEPTDSANAGERETAEMPANPGRDESAMQPTGTQILEQAIGIIFDGGSRGNPGQGYGSYALRWPGAQEQIVRLRFGEQSTNNEAEYDTLIAALESVLKKLREQGVPAVSAQIEVRGDSALVINQVNGEWASKEPRMRTRRDRARTLLDQFGAWRVLYHPRERNVQTLGH